MAWIPLHVHSQYSILNSTAAISNLVEKASEFSLPSLALTDEGNMFGAVEFYKACIGANIKPILGCELFLAPHSRFEKKKNPGHLSGYPIVLLVKDKQGYKNLCRLSSLAHAEGFYYTPRIDKQLLAECREGLICLSGPLNGPIGHWLGQNQEQKALDELLWFSNLFQEDFYLELQRHTMTDEQKALDAMSFEPWLLQRHLDHVELQERVNQQIVQYSSKFGLHLVATNDSHYIDRQDWKAHEILMNIQSGEPCEIWERDSNGNPKNRVLNPKRDVLFSHEYYFKDPNLMSQIFADIPDAVSNSVVISSKCNFDFDFKAKHYPVFIPPHLLGKDITPSEREKAAEKFLRDLCEEGIAKRYTSECLQKVQEKYPDKDPLEVVRSRLNYELDIITTKGMCDYLLIVYDFIAWAKKSGIPVGPGRGSGAGSIILYLVGITDIEPLRFHLFFERFINPERISYPDIDVDICMERRQEVIDYTVKKYGRDRVAQIITFGTMKAKMAIKDVGRVLSVPLAKVNAIAKLVPEDPTITIEKALEIDPELKQQYAEDQETKTLIDLALKLEGSVRNTGVHAAGLIISADPLVDHIPVCISKDSDMALTQYSMKPVEAVGMLKIDFLGLKTLTSIQKAIDAIEKSTAKKIDWVNLPLNDANTFNILNQGKTQGIFQLESGGMQDLAKQLHIDKFEEIIAVGALYRPGPMEMIPSFCARKHGKEPIEFDHPFMAEILAETYGIMVYQEQVMQIASKLALYSLGEGDVLRRAMGKKDKDEMARQREKFKHGALANGVPEELSMLIFDKIEKFASYGFNKSHAAAYGYVTYVTAYLKANYPKQWLAALMTSDSDDTAKVAKVIREAQTMGIAIMPPDVNESEKDFVATLGGIRFAMSAVKGVGEAVVDSIIQERKLNGTFTSLFDFIRRVDGKKVGKKIVEHLVNVGAFDFTGWSRSALSDSIDAMHIVALRNQKESAKGILDLFAAQDTSDQQFATPPAVIREVARAEILKKEYQLLGFYLQGHPLDEYRHILPELSCCPFSEFENLGKSGVCRAAFIIESVSVKVSAKSQKKFAILSISDGIDRYELPIWPEMYEEHLKLIEENQLVYAVLLIENEMGELKLQCKWMADLTATSNAAVAACDAAFDKCKAQLRLSEIKEKSKKNNVETKLSNEKKPEGKVPLQMFISVDLTQVKLSHILTIKELFQASSGSCPVVIEFVDNGSSVAKVNIAQDWGVSGEGKLQELLKKIPSVMHVLVKS